MKTERLLCYGRHGILILSVFFFVLSGCRKPPDSTLKPIRIGCFPVFRFDTTQGVDNNIAICVADLLFQKFAYTDSLFSIPIDWSFQAIDFDSTGNIDYLIDYGERIALDYTVLLFSGIEDGSSSRFSWALYKGSEKLLSQTVNSTKLFSNNLTHRIYLDVTSLIGITPKSGKCPDNCCPEYEKARLFFLRQAFSRADSVLKQNNNESVACTSINLLKAKIYLQNLSANRPLSNPDMEHLLFDLPDSCLQKDLMLSWFYMTQKNWNQSQIHLKRTFDTSPDDADGLLILSRYHPNRYKVFGFSSREQILKRILSINPACEKAALFLGTLAQHRNDKKWARQIYWNMIRIHPRSLNAWMALGKMAMTANDIPEMIRIYEKILQIDPGHADAYYNLGIAYYHENDLKIAQKLFEKAVALDQHRDAHYYLGIIAEREGDTDLAIFFFRERLRRRVNRDDVFAEEARKQLYRLLHPQPESMKHSGQTTVESG